MARKRKDEEEREFVPSALNKFKQGDKLLISGVLGVFSGVVEVKSATRSSPRHRAARETRLETDLYLEHWEDTDEYSLRVGGETQVSTAKVTLVQAEQQGQVREAQSLTIEERLAGLEQQFRTWASSVDVYGAKLDKIHEWIVQDEPTKRIDQLCDRVSGLEERSTG